MKFKKETLILILLEQAVTKDNYYSTRRLIDLLDATDQEKELMYKTIEKAYMTRLLDW